MNDYRLDFDESGFDKLIAFAKVAQLSQGIGNSCDWFGHFIEGIHGTYSRLHGCAKNYYALHAWTYELRQPMRIEYYLSTLLFNMDIASTAPGTGQLLQLIPDESSDLIGSIVAAARGHLGADITFLAEFQGDFKVIRRTAGDGRSVGLDEGRAFPLKETYCYRIASGEWPNVISNARKDGRVKDLALTAQPNIGMYVSVPVVIPGSRC